jgi:hypothetical protein
MESGAEDELRTVDGWITLKGESGMKIRHLIVIAVARYIRSNWQSGGREKALAALQCCALYFLAVCALPMTYAQTKAGSGVATRYIEAVQKADFKTVIDLSYSYQAEVAQIKAQNPQALWPKLTKEYYDAKIASFSEKTDYMGLYLQGLQGMTGDPAQQIQFMRNMVLPNAKWKVTETRTEHVQDSIQFGPYNRTIVYITVTYPTLKGSPFVDGKFLKKTILEFDLNAKVQQVMTVGRVAQGDTPWDAPVTIMNAKWQREGLVGMGGLSAEAFGGKAPYTWKPVCGSYDLSNSIIDQPTNQQIPASLVVNLRQFPTNIAFPLHCSLTITDGSGQSDTVGITVPQMLTGVNELCYVREPWFSRGQGRPEQSNMCLNPIKATDTASTNTASEESTVLPVPDGPPLPSGVSNTSSACGDFTNCMRSAMNAYKSRDWVTASTQFREAANQNLKSGEPWIWLGRIVLMDEQQHRQSELSDAWDKALSLGSRIMIGACHELTFRPCERGDLVLSKDSIAFLVRGTDTVISTPPGNVKPGKVFNNAGAAHITYSFKSEGKNFVVDFFPPGIQCNVNLMVQCPVEGISKQLLLAQYVSQVLPKLASGVLVSGPSQ